MSWETADPETTNRLELRDGRMVEVLAYTTAEEVPGRYRVRDARGGVEVVSADDVIGEVERPPPVDARTLPPFSNESRCPQCGSRFGVRVHFDRDCSEVRGNHFHRICPCGHRGLARVSTVEAED